MINSSTTRLKFTLYCIPSSASMIPRIILSELLQQGNTSSSDGSDDEFHQVQIVNFSPHAKEWKSEQYLKLNPQGIVPTLVVELKESSSENVGMEPIVIYETLAICYFLIELFPNSNLQPKKEDYKKRALFHQWMALICSGLQGDSYHYFYPQRYANEEDSIQKIRNDTEERLYEKLKIFDLELSEKPYLLGDEYSIVDIYLFVVASWTRHMNLKATHLPHLKLFMDRVFNRTLVNQIVKSEREFEPYY